jgi:hypothetical protein
MPDTTNEAITYPSSTANTDLWTHFQNLAEDADAAIFLRKGRGLMGAPTSTSTDGTGTSSTTDTRDAILGNYTFTAIANRRYRVTLSGMSLNGSVANDRFNYNIRDGGASTPTGASGSVAAGSVITYIVGTNGRATTHISATFTPSAGTRTLSLFVARAAGTGVGTPVGSRELYVEDIGPA